MKSREYFQEAIKACAKALKQERGRLVCLWDSKQPTEPGAQYQARLEKWAGQG